MDAYSVHLHANAIDYAATFCECESSLAAEASPVPANMTLMTSVHLQNATTRLGFF